MYIETTRKLLEFIRKSPTAFQAVEEMKNRLTEQGFEELSEKEHWKLVPGGKYLVTRNHSALIAFCIPQTEVWKFHIMASHSDSPAFKIKENPEIKIENSYVKLNVEKYGGMLMAPWFDRPLSVAGRVIIRGRDGLEEKLVNVERDLVMIPNLAIHMNREANNGFSYNPQKDLLPLFAAGSTDRTLLEIIAEQTGIPKEDILSHDLFLYNRMPGTIWGADQEFVSSARLDDLQCAFSSMEGLLRSQHQNSITVHCVMDNEEVGSGTKQGAASTFLKDTLLRINMGLGRTYEEYLMTLAGSFMVSADNAHALHPNHTDKADPVNRPVLNKGIVIKYNANQKYCTDAVSAAEFKELCAKADVPYQTFVNRSDIAGGSTLGNISNTQVPMNTVDIGLPQLAMHSPYETAGVKDTEYLIRMAAELFA
ncbi:M18 family aminopeptidase [Blautia sp. MSJ-19]|uniref:M18 family aminopeptidase n=1 Tax=Blautia sp. MSJ-19 TaxID=2841517 RepID=UPI001C0F0A39|nr:M18 family aminopeptidase [Blautia sp. MSJ-19]MBU5482298.1 M18 family aminopeptidase [Blautia sp. MSJ-19]